MPEVEMLVTPVAREQLRVQANPSDLDLFFAGYGCRRPIGKYFVKNFTLINARLDIFIPLRVWLFRRETILDSVRGFEDELIWGDCL